MPFPAPPALLPILLQVPYLMKSAAAAARLSPSDCPCPSGNECMYLAAALILHLATLPPPQPSCTRSCFLLATKFPPRSGSPAPSSGCRTWPFRQPSHVRLHPGHSHPALPLPLPLPPPHLIHESNSHFPRLPSLLNGRHRIRQIRNQYTPIPECFGTVTF